MVCPSCSSPSRGLCDRCRSTIRPVPDRMVGDVVASAAFHHSGAAAKLVHNFKYRRCMASGVVIATAMAAHMRPEATVLVPVPRALSRRILHGIDPARAIARMIARHRDVEIVDVLSGPVVWRRRAGAPQHARKPVAFRARPLRPRSIDEGHLVLIDDVLTTGSTVAGAIAAITSFDSPSWRRSGAARAIDARPTISVLTATSAGTMDPGARTFPREVA
ncbi:MAG: hypothetical protein QNJ71_10130 [Acidimicrobiia bacterium]|nr:hypothetical protein [Acidimicrobiia bacterium]